ncbi:MAG: hypothetical protein SVX43_00210, partial [Cyanobacteriota bacterium]|nr:hypothetical protein [Cyanobacteriota bacterium]
MNFVIRHLSFVLRNLRLISMAIAAVVSIPKNAIASPATQPLAIEARMSCPTDVETLTQRLLQDLPGYANRVLRRSQILDVPDDTYTFSVLLAGRAEYQPLDLKTVEQSQI